MALEGRVLAGRYAVGERLGRGGMAEVFLATDRRLDRSVAVKVLGSWLANDGAFVERFRREALAAARLSHPNLVAVFDAGSEDGIHYLVMEHVPGETLEDVLRREGRLPPARAIEVAVSVAEALAVAHTAGIVHRDVKPANVMLTPEGRGKLMDLGIARGVEGARLTRTTSILGSAGYLAPEQARGDEVDHRADLYALGCVLYEMLTGAPPFAAEDPVGVAYQHVHEAPAPPRSIERSIPGPLEAVVLRAMEKDPRARYGSARELSAALRSAATDVDATIPLPAIGATSPLPPVGTTSPLPAVGAAASSSSVTRRATRSPAPDPRPRRRRLAPLALAAATLALIGGLSFALLRDQPSAGLGNTPSPSEPPASQPSPPATSSLSTSPSSSPTPSPSVEPPDGITSAAGALVTLVEEGVDGGDVEDRAAREILHELDEALKRFDHGDTDEAIRKLEDLEGRVDEYEDEDEVSHRWEPRFDRALEDLAEQMFLADPPEGDD